MATTALDQMSVITAQAPLAAAGAALDSYDRTALPSVALFEQYPPADYSGAVRHAAYWTAMAARALKSSMLGASAVYYAGKAAPAYVSSSTEGMADVLREAATKIQSYFGYNAQSPGLQIAQYAASRLLSFAEPSSIQRAQEQDDSIFSMVRREYDKYQEMLKKIVRTVAVGTGIISAAVIVGVLWFVFHRRKKGA